MSSARVSLVVGGGGTGGASDITVSIPCAFRFLVLYRDPKMNERISVVVPLYNEEDNVDPLFNKIVAAFDLLPGHDHECLLVNDGSTDGTAAAIDRIAEEDVRFRHIRLSENCGQSAALWAGMTHANGDYILTIDGDLQNDPEDFPKTIELLSDYDCACGHRANRRDTGVGRALSGRTSYKARPSHC